MGRQSKAPAKGAVLLTEMDLFTNMIMKERRQPFLAI